MKKSVDKFLIELIEYFVFSLLVEELSLILGDELEVWSFEVEDSFSPQDPSKAKDKTESNNNCFFIINILFN